MDRMRGGRRKTKRLLFFPRVSVSFFSIMASRPRNATKKEAGYVAAEQLKDGTWRQIRCGSCQFFDASGDPMISHCRLVQGQVHAFGCCNLWTPPGKKPVFDWASGTDIEDIVQMPK